MTEVEKAVVKDFDKSMRDLSTKGLSAAEYVAKVESYVAQFKAALDSASSGGIKPLSGKWCCE